MDRIASAFSVLLQPAITTDSRISVATPERTALDGCVDCIKVVAPSGHLLHMNTAGCQALGVDPEGQFGMPWVPMLHPSIHAAAYDALRHAVAGNTARFEGLSGEGDSLVHWDNLLTPIFDTDGTVKAILCVSRDVSEQTRLKQQLRGAVEREQLLTQEMRHRVKNLFALMAGLVAMTERQIPRSEEVRQFSSILRDKILALHRASDTTFATEKASPGSDFFSDLDSIIRAVLAPYADRVSCSGPLTRIGGNCVTTLALVIHELATNSLKYGSLHSADGSLDISWTHSDNGMTICWAERGCSTADAAPGTAGFGTSVIDRSVASMGGKVHRSWGLNGLEVSIQLPRHA
jgi:two-component sensor histidine kinase